MNSASSTFRFPGLAGGALPTLLMAFLSVAAAGQAQQKSHRHGNMDIRVNPAVAAGGQPQVDASSAARSQRTIALNRSRGLAQLQARVPGAEVSISSITRSVEIVSGPAALTQAAPGRAGADVVREFISANAALYGLGSQDIANLRFIGESVSRKSGLRMVRVEQMVRGLPVFQSETRFILDRDGRLVRSVGLLVPDASSSAAPSAHTVSAEEALAAAMASVDLSVDPALMTVTNLKPDGSKVEVTVESPEIAGPVRGELVCFPIAPGTLLLAWSQIAMTNGEGDWYTLVDANSGALLWRKNIRAHASTQEARFSVYVQADGTTPSDSPSPLSPTTATPGSGLQPPGIARTTVSMSTVQDVVASPNGWINDGGTTTTGNNVDAYLDQVPDDLPDSGSLDNNGRPVGNPDSSTRNRDFLGTSPRDFTMTPPPQGGNPESGQNASGPMNPAGRAFRRGVVTQVFYVSNWYHDQLHALGFDEAAGNFQAVNFTGQGLGGDAVLAEVQDGSGTDNANFATPPDGASGRMQMYVFTGPTVDRDGSLDTEIVVHELTHGLSNRLIGNGAGLVWEVGGGLGEGWSDFYALALLNNSNSDDPDDKYATGAYATYKLGGLTDNYLYGIRRFPYCTDNAVNPLTWADVDDVTFSLSGGIAASPLNFSGAGAGEVHNSGEIWCSSLWEVRSRVIADPAGANGDVPTGNDTVLQIVTDGMKMTPINPSFIEARDALIAADAAANGGANELWIWQGFADRGLGYNAVAPFSRMFGYAAGHIGIGESFDVPYLDVDAVAVDDSMGNNNGAIDPGEPVQIVVTLKNPWRAASFGIASATATLTTSTAGVTITTGSATYPAIPALDSTDGTAFAFQVPESASAGQALEFTITPTSALGTKAVDFTLRVGTAIGNGAPIIYTKSISGGLAIPDNAPRGVVSTFTITDDYEIADLDFRLDDLTHTYTGDVTLLLKGPDGRGSDLISAVGGGIDNGPGDDFLDTVIDDQASGDLIMAPQTMAPFTGSWKPVFNNPSWDNFGFSHDSVGTLSRYNGLSTRGDWKVLVSDQIGGDAGTLNSWSLIVTPRSYTATPFVPATIESRLVFYNRSYWDGNDAGPAANDDNAIAPDKSALLPGGVATFANYTSYSRGLNGLMIDIANLAGTPTAADFVFKTGNDDSPAGWAAAPNPVSVTVRAGAGTGGSDRVTLIWNDNNLDATVDANEAVAKAWLEVTVLVTANTGLAAPDVFYFGNAVGETGNSGTEAFVNATDEIGVRNNLHSVFNPAPITSPYDFDRDRAVNALEVSLVRGNSTTVFNDLNLIDLSSTGDAIPSPAIAAHSGTVDHLRPRFLSVALGPDGTLELWFSALPSSRGVRVQARDELAAGEWRDLVPQPTVRQKDELSVFSVDLSKNPTKRFFRLVTGKGE